jgi:hypothetical protein
MRVSSLFLLFACLITWTGRAEAQEVRRQVQVADLKVQAVAAVDSLGADLTALDASHAGVVEAAEGMASLYAELNAAIANVASLAESLAQQPGQRALASRQAQLLTAVSELEELQAEMNMQFLALQNQMQMESRQYNAVSNALKVRHDTAMNAIRNMK